MSTSISNLNPKTTTLDAAAVRKNPNYIAKFGLPGSIAQHINSRLIFNDVHINDLIIALDIKVNSWVLNCLKSYHLSPTLVIHKMLKVFCNKFYRWNYTEFSKLDHHIRETLKKTFMAKKIYIDTLNNHINQCLANFVINEQLPPWDKSPAICAKGSKSSRHRRLGICF